GIAVAQVGTTSGSGGPLTCSLQQTQVVPDIRTEGYTELLGDIVVVCTGGSPVAVGSQIPTTSLTLTLSSSLPFTNRILGSSNATDALLLIDEPNNGGPGSQAGYGPLTPQKVCSSALNGAGAGGCVQYVGTSSVSTSYPGVPVDGSPSSNTPAANIFQGVATGTSTITFNGIPVLPPVTAGFARVYRITNLRVSAVGLAELTSVSV